MTDPTTRREPADWEEYQYRVIRRTKAAIEALEGLSAFDYLIDRKLADDLIALAAEVKAAHARVDAWAPGKLYEQYDVAQEYLGRLDGAVANLMALFDGARGRIRSLTPAEEKQFLGDDNDTPTQEGAE